MPHNNPRLASKRKAIPAHQPRDTEPRVTVWACVHPDVDVIIRDIAREQRRSRSWVLAELIDELLGRTKK